MAQCSECGQDFPDTDLITYQNSRVCAACKPILIQKIKEGVALPNEVVYGGFWIRLGAKFIDGILLTVVNGIINTIVTILFATSPDSSGAFWAIGFNMIFSLSTGVFYSTWMLGKYEATLGKMACGLKVIVADGSPISYWRAAGRHFAEILSGIILYIGYIMAAFDEEKRTLHDRICNTRVVKK